MSFYFHHETTSYYHIQYNHYQYVQKTIHVNVHRVFVYMCVRKREREREIYPILHPWLQLVVL